MGMNQVHILYPMAAMMVLTCIVMALMLRERVAEMKERRIHPQKVASSSQMSATLQNTRAADNYKNLFEMPVFFHALCLAVLATETAGPGMVVAAWAYVGLRCVHSAIHLGYNKVMHRFYVFLASCVLLAGMWVAFIVDMAARH